MSAKRTLEVTIRVGDGALMRDIAQYMRDHPDKPSVCRRARISRSTLNRVARGSQPNLSVPMLERILLVREWERQEKARASENPEG